MLMFLYSLGRGDAEGALLRVFVGLGGGHRTLRAQQDRGRHRQTLRDYSGGSTDYGQAFSDFRKLCMDEVDNRTTIIILGDARNNYGDPRTDILKEMYDRSKRVIWLNPESRNTWNVGDAEMRKYTAYIHQARSAIRSCI